MRRIPSGASGPWCGCPWSFGPTFHRYFARTLWFRRYSVRSKLLDLAVFQLHWCRTTEDRYRHLEARFFFVDVLDHAVERRERAVGNAHLLANLEDDRGLGPLDAF